MRISIPISKRAQAIIAIAVAAALVLSGIFAWSSFFQNRINTFDLSKYPGVNLHDDFDEGPDKDVYVENSGEVGVFVRVRLTEYLETALKGSLIEGHTTNEGDEKFWHPHNGAGGIDACVIDMPYTYGEMWAAENFHDYYTWNMGGQKYYKTAVAQLGHDGAFADDPEVCVDTTVYTEPDEENGIRQTLFASVITMEQWLAGDKSFGDFWIVDTDGWCYWAQTLKPGEATGLLLDSVERTNKPFGSDATYMIDVWMQAVDEMDIELFSVRENGGTTDAGNLLIQLLATSILIEGEDGNYYKDNYNGTFILVSDKNGKPDKAAKPFVPLGEPSVDAPERLYIDDTLTLTRLVWNGDEYTNFNAFDGNAPYYNIGESGDMSITLTGAETGEDGVLYLKLSDGTYLASVTKNSPYTQSYPGTGPFAVLYSGEDGKIGSGDDMRYDVTTFEARYFYHIGNGVYVEVNEGGTESKDTPVIYYFAGLVLDDADTIVDNLKYPGDKEVERINYLFPFSIAVDDEFSLALDSNGDLIGLVKNENGEYEMKELVDDGGELYIDLGDGLYIGPGGNGVFGDMSGSGSFAGSILEDDGDGTKVVIAQPKPPGKGTETDPFRIRNRADMDWVSRQADLASRTFAGEYLRVENDIDMGSESFTPINGVDTVTLFQGTFDGNDKTISGLVVTKKEARSGLFGYIGVSGLVKNLTLDGAYIDADSYAGVLAGINKGTVSGITVKNSTVDGTTTLGGVVGSNSGGTIENSCFGVTTSDSSVAGTGHSVGGIVGESSGSVENCQNRGIVTRVGTGNGLGGIVGRNNSENAVVQNCVNMGSVSGGGNYVGGIAGYNIGTVTDCYALGNVSGTGSYVGGVAGYNNSAISNSAFNGDISGAENVGGVVGYSYGVSAEIKSCYAWGNVIGSRYIGGVIGYNNGTMSYTYHAKGTLTATHASSEGIGGIVGRQDTAQGIAKNSVALTDGIVGNGVARYKTIGYNLEHSSIRESLFAYDGMTLSGSSSEWNTENGIRAGDTVIDTQTPTYFWWSQAVGGDFANPDIWVWDSVNKLPVLKAHNPGLTVPSGDSEQDPYLLGSRADLDALSAAVNGGNAFSGKFFELEQSITMGSANFTPIGNEATAFQGVFDGDNHTINGLVINKSDVNAAFFGTIGVIGNTEIGVKNIIFEKANITGVQRSGVIAGINVSAFIDNVRVIDSKVTGTTMVGGLVGVIGQGARITDSSFTGTDHFVSGSSTVGGIVGSVLAGGDILRCVNTAPVKGTGSSVGGIVGVCNGTVTVSHCFNAGSVEGTQNVGGVAGNGTHAIERCANTGNVTGASCVGGIAGINTGSILDCYAWGDVTGTVSSANSGVGGIVGGKLENGGSITNVYHAKGSISGTDYTGGIYGFCNNATVNNAFAMADSITGGNTGTIAGVSAADAVTNSYYLSGSGATATNGSSQANDPAQQSDWPIDSFNFTDVWTWDATNKLPILQGATMP